MHCGKSQSDVFCCAVLCRTQGSVRLSLVNIEWLCIAESQVDTAQSGTKTPPKGSYSSLHVVITEKLYLLRCKGCYLSHQNLLVI